MQLFIESMLFILAGLVYINSHAVGPFILLVAVNALYDIEYIKLFKHALYIKVFQCIIWTLAMPFLAYLKTGIKLYTEMATPNGVGLTYWICVICYLCLQSERKRNELRLYEIIIIAIAGCIMYMYSGCTTALIAILIIIFLLLAFQFKLPRRLVNFCIIIGVVGIVAGMMKLIYSSNADLFSKWGTFGSRFFSVQIYLNHYSINLFGNDLTRMDVGPLDFGYYALLINFGIIYFIFFIGTNLVFLVHCLLKKYKLLSIAFISFAAYMIAERSVFNIMSNPLLIYMSVTVYDILYNELKNGKFK